MRIDDIATALSQGLNGKSLENTLKIDLGDAGILHIDDDCVTRSDKQAATTVSTSLEVMTEVVSGKLDLVLAYYEGHAEIEGSQNLALRLSHCLAANGAIEPVQRFRPSDGAADIAGALRTTGAAIIDDCVPADAALTVAAELRPHFDRYGQEYYADFEGYKTLRLSEILARSRTSAQLIGNALTLAVIDEILLDHCINYRIGSCTGIEILPGEAQQELHRDDGIYPLAIQGMELQVSAMWALSEFTQANGATHLIPGSHRGPPHNVSHQPDATVQTPMAIGSVLLYLGSLLHGGGANQTDTARMGLINTYALGWLRQEENHYLAIPRDIADSYPQHIRALMGYQPHGPLLGSYPTRDYEWEL